jgi:hypothetical protein
MGNFCYTCKKRLLWGQKKFPYSDIIEIFPTVVPVGLTSKDILCTDCIHDLANQAPLKVHQDENSSRFFYRCFSCGEKLTTPSSISSKKQIQGWLNRRIPPENMTEIDRMCFECVKRLPSSDHEKTNTKNNTELISNIKKECKIFRESFEHTILEFEISNWKINGNIMKGNFLCLASSKPFTYYFWVGSRGKFRKNNTEFYQTFWSGKLNEFASDHSETNHNIDECLTFQFESQTGKLVIETKNNTHFELQLKFQNQALIVDQFLKFINLRNYKISDKIIKEIKLKNNSKKIELRINKKELHEHEEVLTSYSDPMTFPFEKGKPELLIRDETQIITNLRIMGDVWYYPAFFINPEVKEVGFGQLEEITNFTHDQYDEIFISKNPASFQGSVKFMSKGKPFWGLRNTPEPERLVELIKYAKSQFESQDKKIIEPIVSSSDDDPLKILKMRLAKGEITLEEFNEIKENLV